MNVFDARPPWLKEKSAGSVFCSSFSGAPSSSQVLRAASVKWEEEAGLSRWTPDLQIPQKLVGSAPGTDVSFLLVF